MFLGLNRLGVEWVGEWSPQQKGAPRLVHPTLPLNKWQQNKLFFPIHRIVLVRILGDGTRRRQRCTRVSLWGIVRGRVSLLARAWANESLWYKQNSVTD